MLELSWPEMAIIFMVGLVVIGPRDLPKLLRSCKKWVRTLRAYVDQIWHTIDAEEYDTSLKKTAHELNQSLSQIRDMHGDLQDTYSLDDVLPLCDDTKKHVSKVSNSSTVQKPKTNPMDSK